MASGCPFFTRSPLCETITFSTQPVTRLVTTATAPSSGATMPTVRSVGASFSRTAGAVRMPMSCSRSWLTSMGVSPGTCSRGMSFMLPHLSQMALGSSLATSGCIGHQYFPAAGAASPWAWTPTPPLAPSPRLAMETRSMPQMGQLPERSESTDGCIGQTYFASERSVTSWPVRAKYIQAATAATAMRPMSAQRTNAMVLTPGGADSRPSGSFSSGPGG